MVSDFGVETSYQVSRPNAMAREEFDITAQVTSFLIVNDYTNYNTNTKKFNIL